MEVLEGIESESTPLIKTTPESSRLVLSVKCSPSTPGMHLYAEDAWIGDLAQGPKDPT